MRKKGNAVLSPAALRARAPKVTMEATLPQKYVGMRFYAEFFGISYRYALEIQQDMRKPAHLRKHPEHILSQYPRMEKVGHYRVWGPYLAQWPTRRANGDVMAA